MSEAGGSRLRDRLRTLRGAEAQPRLSPAPSNIATQTVTAPSDVAARLRRLLRKSEEAGSSLVTASALAGRSRGASLPGELIAEGHRAVRTRHPLPALELDAESRAHVGALAGDMRLRDVPLERLLFLDTETTGLSTGAGTVAFLVGLAWMKDGHLVVEQHLLERMGGETSLLGAVGGILARFDALVTFNGKSFDVPLLQGRGVLARVPLRWPALHADLLHPSRRFLSHVLADVRLVSLERRLLGHARTDDIDGADIPEAFRAFLRGGETEDILRVLEHNALDLVGLARLLPALIALASGSAAGSAPRADSLALADHRLRLGDRERACVHLAATDDTPAEPIRRTRVARLLKRLSGREAARQQWQDLIACSGAPEPAEELAKILEHDDRDPASARAVVAAALARATHPQVEARLLKRLGRLDSKLRRLNRMGAPAGAPAVGRDGTVNGEEPAGSSRLGRGGPPSAPSSGVDARHAPSPRA